MSKGSDLCGCELHPSSFFPISRVLKVIIYYHVNLHTEHKESFGITNVRNRSVRGYVKMSAQQQLHFVWGNMAKVL